MSGKQKQTLEEGFNKFVIRTSEGCWDWSGYCSKNPGYGEFRVSGRIERAHRASWILHFGVIPKGMFVCHKCDNKRCSNPDHLFLGTCRDNNLDAIRKKILPFGQCGTENHNAKLSDKDVFEIKKMLGLGITQKVIANFFCVSQALISLINQNKLWGGLFLRQA